MNLAHWIIPRGKSTHVFSEVPVIYPDIGTLKNKRHS